MKKDLKPKDDGWVCTKCKAKLPTATDALNHRCGVVVVPLASVRAALEKEMPCERIAVSKTYKMDLEVCEKHVPYPDAQQGVPCPNCSARAAIMKEVEEKQ